MIEEEAGRELASYRCILGGPPAEPDGVVQALHAQERHPDSFQLLPWQASPPFELVSPALPALANLLNSTDEEVLVDACWTLSYLADGSNDRMACADVWWTSCTPS